MNNLHTACVFPTFMHFTDLYVDLKMADTQLTLCNLLLQRYGVKFEVVENETFNVMYCLPTLHKNNKTIFLLYPNQTHHFESKYIKQITTFIEQQKLISTVSKRLSYIKVYLFEDDKLVKFMKALNVKSICKFLEIEQNVPLDVTKKLTSEKPLVENKPSLKDLFKHHFKTPNLLHFENNQKRISNNVCEAIKEELDSRVIVVNKKYVIAKRFNKRFQYEEFSYDWYLFLHVFCKHLQDLNLYARINKLFHLADYIIVKHGALYEVVLLCKDREFYRNFSSWFYTEKHCNGFNFKKCILGQIQLIGNVGIKDNVVVLTRHFPSLEVLQRYNIKDVEKLYQKMKSKLNKSILLDYVAFEYKNNDWEYVDITL